jgi:hypothetical protein
MAAILQAQDQIRSEIAVPPAPLDHYSILLKAIAAISSDPARLRKLVYEMALHDLEAATVEHDRVPEPTRQATTLLELERALQFELAIEHIEKGSALLAAGSIGETTREPPARLASEQMQPDCCKPTEQHAVVCGDRIPAFLDPHVRGLVGGPDDVTFSRPRVIRSRLLAFAQFVAAPVLSAALYIVIAGWLQTGRQPAFNSASANPPPKQIATSFRSRETVGGGYPETIQRHESAPSQLFPLPKAYGVYAGSGGRITALEQLPLAIPAAQFEMSAEITAPSHTLVPGDNLKFVVFKRDIAGAPESAAVRVVARVARTLTFVDGRPTVAPVAAQWRMRDKAYQVKALPLEGNPEMLVIEPDAGFVRPDDQR